MSFQELRVPRRPAWDASTTAAELNRREKESFLNWRRDLAMLEEASENLEVTPFEKNLEVWRQLWHVRERSDVVVQIVDARNPLFYRSKDLDAYAREGEAPRRTVLVVNKSDFLSDRQRECWGDFFKHEGVTVVFFSAKDAQAEIDEEAKQLKQGGSAAQLQDEDEDDDAPVTPLPAPTTPVAKPSAADTPYPVLTRVELLEYFSSLASTVLGEVGMRAKDKGLIKFGMVGFPNVGKSSVINALLGASTYSHKTQRVAVGATPGKTKHFQTLILSDSIMLCDCPGLVFPSFVNSKAEMYCCGVLPISQLRDHIGASVARSVVVVCCSLLPVVLIVIVSLSLSLSDPQRPVPAHVPPHPQARVRAHVRHQDPHAQGGQGDGPRERLRAAGGAFVSAVSVSMSSVSDR